MYRSAAKRLLLVPSLVRNAHPQVSHIRTLTIPNSPRFASTSAPSSQTPSDQSPNYPHHRSPQAQSQTPNSSDSASSSSSYSAFAEEEEGRRYESQTSRGSRPRAEYQDEQARVLTASLRHVPRLGWTEAAMIAGAREADVSPSIIGSFPRKEAALVEFFMDECLQRLIDRIDSEEDLRNLIPSERISKLVKIRLEMQAPYISKWPQALSIQAQPQNIPASFKQRAMLVDEIWHAAGDEATDVDWYAKRTVLGAIYSTTEVYMLTDSSPGGWITSWISNDYSDLFSLQIYVKIGFQSTLGRNAAKRREPIALPFAYMLIPRGVSLILLSIVLGRAINSDFRDTWTFLDGRVKDAFDMKKSIQEAKYLAEAVGAGMGSSLQGFMKRVFQG